MELGTQQVKLKMTLSPVVVTIAAAVAAQKIVAVFSPGIVCLFGQRRS